MVLMTWTIVQDITVVAPDNCLLLCRGLPSGRERFFELSARCGFYEARGLRDAASACTERLIILCVHDYLDGDGSLSAGSAPSRCVIPAFSFDLDVPTGALISIRAVVHGP